VACDVADEEQVAALVDRTVMIFVPFTSTERTPGGHGLLGAMPLLSSHAGTSPTGDERHCESRSAPTADSLKASQLAAGRSPSSRPDVTTNPNSKPERSGEPPSAGSVAFHVV